MTDKQILIDGVDVSGCGYYFDNKCRCMDASIMQDFYSCSQCNSNPNCYFKQLKRKEQECERLKKVNRHIEHNRTQKADKLMRIEKLITACSTGYTDEFIQELLVILHEPEPNSFENKYKQTLIEIKELLLKTPTDSQMHCVNAKSVILQKCEVLDEN